MNNIFVLILCSMFISENVMAEKIQVNGVVKEMGSRRLMKGTKIFFLPQKTVAVTNDNGEFSVSLDDQIKWSAIVNLSGYKKFQENIEIKKGRKFNIYLEKIEYNLFETTIVAKSDKRDPTKNHLLIQTFIQLLEQVVTP